MERLVGEKYLLVQCFLFFSFICARHLVVDAGDQGVRETQVHLAVYAFVALTLQLVGMA